MANSTSWLDLISSSQAQKEVTANAMFDAVSHTLGARRATTCAGLTWGYYGGNIWVDGVLTQIANGTISLFASSTQYVEMTRAGVVSVTTVGFTAGRIPLYTIVTGATTVTSYTDHRVPNFPMTGLLSKSVAGGAEVTLTAAEARCNILHFTGTLTANINVVLPTVAQKWTVYNNTTGAYTLTVKTAAGSGFVVIQGYRAEVYCDGTAIVSAASLFDAHLIDTTDPHGSTMSVSVAVRTPKIYPPSADGVTAFQITKFDGSTVLFNVDSTNSRIGIGTVAPAARLHVVDSSGICMIVADKETDATFKFGVLGAAHYTNAQPPVCMIRGYNDASANNVYIGGGSGSCNAATVIAFLTGATPTTLTGTERMRITGTGWVGVGVNPQRIFHISDGSSGSTQYNANAQLVLENDGNTALQLLNRDTDTGYILFGDTVGGYYGWISYAHATDVMNLRVANSTAMEIHAGPKLFVGTVFTNAGMTAGATFSQGAAVDEIVAFKGSDIAQPCTSQAEGDTFGFFKKAGGASGGLKVHGLSDTSAYGLLLTGTVGVASPSGTYAGVCFQGNKRDGATVNVAAFGAGETLFTWMNNTDVKMAMLGDGSLSLFGATPVGSIGINAFRSLTDPVNNYDYFRLLASPIDYSVGGSLVYYHFLCQGLPRIVSGQTNSGIHYNALFSMLRNANAGLPNDDGTFSQMRCVTLNYGHLNTPSAGTPLTTTMYGLMLVPYYVSGTIGTLYDIYLSSGTSGGTITTRWGIYQEAVATSKNYLGLVTGIGYNGALHADSIVEIGSTTGGVITLMRNDVTVTSGESLGAIEWRTIDTTVTTDANEIAAKIEVTAGADFTTDTAPGVMKFWVRNTATAGSSAFVEGIAISADTAVKLGFFGASPVVKPTVLTTALTTVTFTAPGTPDYAWAAGTNTSAWGWTTNDEFKTAASVIANLQTRLNELETKLRALGLLT